MSISWNTGRAAERARHNLKLKNKRRPAAKAPSSKLQAPARRAGFFKKDKKDLTPIKSYDRK